MTEPVAPKTNVLSRYRAAEDTSGGMTEARREAQALAKKAAELRGGPLSFAGKYAYRGVNSDPRVYEGRGGFQPHQIPSLQVARSSLQSLMNKQDGLSQYAFRWQERKDKADGYFLSTGLSVEDSYDHYPYLYRINIGSLFRRKWEDTGFEFLPDSIANCMLYTDNADVNASNLIAIICLSGGVGRSYELLIISPVPPKLCDVEQPKGSKKFITFDEWKQRNPPRAAKAAST